MNDSFYDDSFHGFGSQEALIEQAYKQGVQDGKYSVFVTRSGDGEYSVCYAKDENYTGKIQKWIEDDVDNISNIVAFYLLNVPMKNQSGKPYDLYILDTHTE